MSKRLQDEAPRLAEEVAMEINFLDLVSLPLMDLESLLAAMKALLGEAAEENENHLLNLVRLAEKERRKISDQLDMQIDGEKTVKKAFESLSVEVA